MVYTTWLRDSRPRCILKASFVVPEVPARCDGKVTSMLAAGGQLWAQPILCQTTTSPSNMGSRAARSLLGPLVDGYRDLETSKQGFERPSVSHWSYSLHCCHHLNCSCLLLCTLNKWPFHVPAHWQYHTTVGEMTRTHTDSNIILLMQTAGGNNTMKKTDWENMDLGGGGGGAKAAEIFK